MDGSINIDGVVLLLELLNEGSLMMTYKRRNM
jgi:hypothetical protein